MPNKLRLQLKELLAENGLDGNDRLLKGIINIFSNPHGLNPEEVKELSTEDMSREFYSSFNGCKVPMEFLHLAANYGLEYGLTSMHDGYVPKGNLYQWFHSIILGDVSQENKIVYKRDLDLIKKSIKYHIDTINLDDYDRETFKNLVDHKRCLEEMLNYIS